MKEILRDVELEIEKRGITPEEVSETISSIPPLLNRRIIMGYACLDEQTKLFTKRGILDYEDIREGDEIFSIDLETGQLVENHVGKVLIYPFDGELVSFANNKNHTTPFNILMTPNHRVIEHVKFKKLKGESNNFTGLKNMFVYKTAESVYNRKDPSNIPSAIYSYNSRTQQGKGEKIDIRKFIKQDNIHFNTIELPYLMDLKSFLQAAAWYITEGTLNKSGVVIWQSKEVHPDNFPKIINAFQGIGLHPKEYTDNVNISSVTLSKFFLEQFGKGSHEKSIPRWILDLNENYLRIFWDTLLLGDGHKNKKQITSVSKKLIEAYSEIAIKLGYTVSMCKNGISIYVSDKKGYTIRHKKRELVHYTGEVWCIQTLSQNYQNFLAVRNGKFFFTGNSVAMVDRENQKISIEALRDAVKRFMADGRYRIISIFHSDAVVGRVLPKWTDPKTGKSYETTVDDIGWKVVVELRDDIELAEKVWDEIIKGNLRSFSVAGTSKKKHNETSTGNPFTEIDELDLLECTICSVPVNQMSVFSLLWDPDRTTI